VSHDSWYLTIDYVFLIYISTPVEPAYHSQRCGHVFLLCYASDELGVGKESFVARIEISNRHSIVLFARLEFGLVCIVSIFDQVKIPVV
jgi:hypothetical protein